jgi:hypothetical protein
MQKLLQKHGTGIIALLSVVLLLFLFGCKEKDEFEYRATVTIEYFDKDDEGYQLMNLKDRDAILKDHMPFEILSFTEMNRVQPIGGGHYSGRNIVFIRLSEYDVRGTSEHHYTVKYKAPSVRGESVEEIKLTFKVNTTDCLLGRFTEAWYNGVSIPIVAQEIYNPTVQNLQNPQYVFNREEWERGMKEHFYNGNMVAGTMEGSIHIVLPIEKPKP